MTQPLGNFDEQFNSWADIEDHRTDLVARARQLLDEKPDADPVGLIWGSQTRLSVTVRAAIERHTGKGLDNAPFTAVIEMSEAILLLLGTSPTTMQEFNNLAHLPGRLPIMCFTQHGVRFASVPLAEAG